MKPFLATRAAAILCGATFAALPATPRPVRAQETPPVVPATVAVLVPPQSAAPETADMPAPKRTHDGMIEPTFLKMHNSFLARGKSGPIGVLFLGASIMQFWSSKAPDVWDAHYGKYAPADFGISGDKTQNILWRIDNGEFDGISPKVIVIMVGSNNISIGPQDAVIRGEEKIIAELHEKLPNTKILSLGVFPRGADPADPKVAAMRAEVKAINAALAKLDDGDKTRVIDIGDKFMDANGVISKDILSDSLHPTHAGYVIWADAMQPTLDAMMK